MDKQYVVAKYLRISSDDGLHGDSQSITGQRDLIESFVSSHSELRNAECLEFSDDGFSGTSFNRPGVEKLMNEVKSGRIQCIVVKDFSRFGRNYIEVGDYLEQIFPFLRVRFISINDGYDSANQACNAGDVGVAFKHLCNDYYSKDLSRKIRAGLKVRRESGEYVSPSAPFGYKKPKEDKHRLVTDERTAGIVRQIFDMAISGKTPTQIAVALNADKVATPLMYSSKKAPTTLTGNPINVWTNAAILTILHDIRYTGAVTSGMYGVNGIGRRDLHKNPVSEWHIAEDKHESIVSKDEFAKAQLCYRKTTPAAKTKSKVMPTNALPVTVRCGGCGHALVKSNTKAMTYYCRYRNLFASDTCFIGKIETKTLKSVLMTSIQRLSDVAKEESRKPIFDSVPLSADLLKQMQLLQKEIERLTNQKLTLYKSYSDEVISREDYFIGRKSIDERIQELTSELSVLEQQYSKQECVIPAVNPIHETLQSIPCSIEYSHELVTALVDYIVVHDADKIEIKWKFSDTLVPNENYL